MCDSGSYRWIVLGVSTAVNALGWAARSTFALFYVAILQEFAWGRGATALGYSLSWLCFVVFAPLAGWLHDRWGAPTVVTTGGVALGVALALTGQVTSLTQYYLCFGILSAAGIACIVIPATTIVTGWFVRARGTAMGILSTANSASAVAFYPVNAWLIVTLGWRRWLVAFGAARTMAGNLLGGWLSDHFGRGWIFALGSIVAVIGIVCLGLTRGPHDLPLLLIYTASGLGFGMRIAQLSAIPADVFSGAHLGAIL